MDPIGLVSEKVVRFWEASQQHSEHEAETCCFNGWVMVPFLAPWCGGYGTSIGESAM